MKFLNKSYPFLFSLKKTVIFAVIIGVVSGFLNSIRLNENFVNQHLTLPKIQVSFIFSLIVFFSIILILHFFTKFILSEKTKDNWTIFKELSLVSLLLLTIITFNYSFLILISKNNSDVLNIAFFFKIVFYALTTGLVISTIITWINYTIILKENLKQSLIHNNNLKKILKTKQEKTDDLIINLPSNIQTENIIFNLEQLLFIKSDGNYVEIYSQINNKLKTQLYRASIQSIEDKLINYPYIIRTHRTYLVNIKNISHTKGNARNYQLYFEGAELSIPVARSRFKRFNEVLTANS